MVARARRFRDAWERLDDEEKQAFSDALSALEAEIRAEMNPEEDRAYVENVLRTQRRLEICGRTLIHFGLDPITLGAGVVTLTMSKFMHFSHMHNVMHQQYDHLGDPRY